MKKRTINLVLKKKMREWWDSIEDEKLRKLVEKETIISGGCITSMLLQETPNDYDIYLRTQDTVERLAQYYVDRFTIKSKKGKDTPIKVVSKDGRVKVVIQSAGIASEQGSSEEYDYFEQRGPDAAQTYAAEIIGSVGDIQDTYEDTETQALEEEGEVLYRPVFMSTNAITLSHKVQIVLRFYGTPEEIHDNYDFEHCTNYWTKEDGIVLNQAALEAILAKELRYVGSRYPICSLIRTRKFIQRGWSINAGQYVKMAFQVSQLDLTDIKVLEEQLTGVDQAYFAEVIRILGSKDQKRLEGAFLFEIINKMF